MMMFCLLRVEKYEMRLVIEIVLSMSQEIAARLGKLISIYECRMCISYSVLAS